MMWFKRQHKCMVCFLWIITSAHYGYAANEMGFGFGLGVEGVAHDQEFALVKDQISLSRVEFLPFSSLEFPSIEFRLSPNVSIRSGFQEMLASYQHTEVSYISEAIKVVTDYDLSVLSFYASYLYAVPLVENVSAQIQGGPVLMESVLTKNEETFLITESGGKERQQIKKNFQVDYTLGAMVGLGVSYVLAPKHEIIAQLLAFVGESTMTSPKGRTIQVGSTHLQIIYLYFFDA
ncbi:hypothetical protein WDW89_02255 [Deltaproteobacteria bacterium TL4]